MALLSSDTFKKFGHVNKEYKDFIDELAEKYEKGPCRTEIKPSEGLDILDDEFLHKRKYKAGCFSQFGILLGRSISNCGRLFMDEIMRIIAMIILGLFMMSLFWNVKFQLIHRLTQLICKGIKIGLVSSLCYHLLWFQVP